MKIGSSDCAGRMPARDEGPTEKSLRTNAEAARKMARAAREDGLATGKTGTPAEDMSYGMIVAKLRGGQELSGWELSVLKKRDPALYGKAVRAQRAREQMRSRLQKAKTSKDFEAAKHAVSSMAAASAMEGAQAAGAPGAAAQPGGVQPLAGQLAITHSALRNEYGQFGGKRQRAQLEETLKKTRQTRREEEQQAQKTKLKTGKA